MSKPPFNPDSVEEADVGICMDGWDNFLLHDTTELEEYLAALKSLKATQCAAVIQEVLELVAATSPENPIDVTESHKLELDKLWHRYQAASGKDQPQERARKKAPKRKKPRFPVTDRDYYEFFGPEDASTHCRSEGCTRGTVQHSVYCRPHHFEKVMRKPCPWSD